MMSHFLHQSRHAVGEDFSMKRTQNDGRISGFQQKHSFGKLLWVRQPFVFPHFTKKALGYTSSNLTEICKSAVVMLWGAGGVLLHEPRELTNSRNEKRVKLIRVLSSHSNMLTLNGCNLTPVLYTACPFGYLGKKPAELVRNAESKTQRPCADLKKEQKCSIWCCK